jgi:hypothetical protein
MTLNLLYAVPTRLIYTFSFIGFYIIKVVSLYLYTYIPSTKFPQTNLSYRDFLLIEISKCHSTFFFDLAHE